MPRVPVAPYAPRVLKSSHFMRCLSILMLGLLAYAADPRETKITAAEASFGKCWDARDTECLARLVTDDFVQITRTARLMDKASSLEGMKTGIHSRRDPNTPAPPRRDLKIRFYGNTAIETYVETGPGPSRGLAPLGCHQPHPKADSAEE